METITACENVCRDFGAWWPAMWAWLADFGTFAIGASAIVALVSYRAQKKHDQEFEVLSERRKIYASFMAAAELYFWELVQENKRPNPDKDYYQMPTRSYVRLERNKARLALNASAEFIEVAASYIQSLKDFHSAVANYRACGKDKKKENKLRSDAAYSKAEEKRLSALSAARNEILEFSNGNEDDNLELRKLYRFPLDEGEQAED